MVENNLPLIYVIDDDHDDFYFLNRILLKRFPHLEIQHFPRPDVFRDQMKTITKPSAIILDINMPIMNGFEVINIIKKSDEWAKIPVLFLSTADDTKYKEKAFSLGAVNYLVKPVDPSDWEVVIDQIMKEVNAISKYIPE